MRMFLPLIDVSQPLSVDAILGLQQSLARFGAFRLVAPQISQPQCDNVFSKAQIFFLKDIRTKEKTMGYSAFRAERVRGKTAIPKETIYLFQKSALIGLQQDPPADLVHSVEALRNNLNLLRENLIPALFSILQGKDHPLAENAFLGNDSVGIHYYQSRRLHPNDDYFNPPHKDSGLFTVLLQKPGEGADGLEIADLSRIKETKSEAVGKHANFQQVSFMPGEVVVLAGTRMEHLFGANRVRACVHRVRKSATKDAVARQSIAIFCSPSVASLSQNTGII